MNQSLLPVYSAPGFRNWQQNFIYERDKRVSELCKAQDWFSPWFQRWVGELKEEPRFHRKQWEFVYILQALWERGCIKKGKKGMVFAVGTEPLPSLLANYHVDILATDILPAEGLKKGWDNGNQLCFGTESLNTRSLADPEIFERHVRYLPVDMNHIPDELDGFDFNWSSCSFEHLGSLEKGRDFLINQMKTLKPGGWAVHTTEYNLSSEDKTLESGDTVIFRRNDLEMIAADLRLDGHYVERFDFSTGGLPEDYMVDVLPHEQKVHLKLQINEFVVTSIGLIIRKKQD